MTPKGDWAGFTGAEEHDMTWEQSRKAMMGHPTSERTQGVSPWKSKAGGIAATVVQLAAVCSLLMLVAGGAFGYFRKPIVSMFSVLSIAVTPSLVVALVLGVLGAALRRRKRAALYTLMLFQAVGLVWTLLMQAALLWNPALLSLRARELRHIPDKLWLLTAADVVSIGLLFLLFVLRPAFPARLASTAWRDGLSVLVGGMVAVVLVGWGLTEAFPGHLTGTWERFAWVANQATGELVQLRRLGVAEGPGSLDALLDLSTTVGRDAAL